MSRLLPILLLSAACVTAAGTSTPSTPRAPFAVKVVGHGPPMLLIPGLSSSGEVWDEVVAHYQDRYTCHVLTLAGFAGQAPLTGEALLPAAHAGLIRYLQEQKLEHPVLVGHSLGGFLGLWVASSNPELVGQLVIVDSAPSLAALQAPSITPTEAQQQADQLRGQLRMATPDQRAMYARMASKMLVSAPAQAERVMTWSLKSDPDTVADAAYYVMTHDLRPDLGTVRAPTLVVGTWLSYRPYATREQLLERFTSQYARCPTCTVTLNDKARHFVMLDDPQGLLAQIDGFLRTSAASTPISQAP
jgi:pimeloyl-ACP methyl ester carboxylesterase